MAQKKTAKALDVGKKVGKRVGKKSIEVAGKAANEVRKGTNKGIIVITGAESYLKKAALVNAELDVAIAKLEDALKRRDLDIERLTRRISELESTRTADKA